jgi:hypothetical protein
VPELILLLAIMAGIGILGALALIITPSLLQTIGFLTLAAGLAEGIPAGLWYHVVLYRTIADRGSLPSRWWIHPSRFHARLTPEEHRSVRRWFVLGGLGYVLAVAGGLAAIVGLLLERS